MADHHGFVTHVLDMLEGLGDAASRAMFGAHGIYVDGMIIGLVEDDTLYLKVDDQNRGRFEAAGGRPFTYHDKAGHPRSMSYWTVPDQVLDDAGAMVEWARTSLDAALRSKAPGKKTAAGVTAKRANAVDTKAAKKTAAGATARRTDAAGKVPGAAAAPRARTTRSATAAARATKPRRKSR